MADITKRGPWLWEELNPRDARAGATLAALRAGVSREPGDVAELWRHYRAVVPDEVAARGLIGRNLLAEHTALTLFGLHQQSREQPMHKTGLPLGSSLRALRASKQFKDNPDALDKRINAAAATESVRELAEHLRGLVKLLRDQEIALDYSALVGDLADWHYPDARARVRRRWGAQYYVWTSRPGNDGGEAPADTPAQPES